jgi:hypothetical protein
MLLVTAAALSVVESGASRVRATSRALFDVQGTQICEAGTQQLVLNLWLPLKTSQVFTSMDSLCGSASTSAPAAAVTGVVDSNFTYASGVIAYNVVDSYTRTLTVRTLGWIDQNGNGVADTGEPQKVVDVSYTFKLARSQVFDYTYFVNNYGWMQGFGPSNLIVNGDMRANGNFSFTSGSPTVNGSVYATQNSKLSPASAGLVNAAPVKWTTSQYASNMAAGGSGATNNQNRWRPAYNATTDGAQGSTLYEQWRDNVFDSNGTIVNNRLAGTALGDVNGTRAWASSSPGSSTTTLLDSTPTSELVMPDLSNIGTAADAPNANGSYAAQSKAYTDPKATFQDGTANPLYGQGSYLEVWNSTLNNNQGAYQTLSTSGVISGSAIAVGTTAHPILIHGPVTVTQDLVITGSVSGQGTIYTGRNVQVVGSVTYTNPPNFSSSSPLGAANEKADMLGLAANGSVIMGDTSQFSGSSCLQYMTPPFTHARTDDLGNVIPAFDANATDSCGCAKYQSLVGASTIHNLSSSINQIDAILYTNNVCGGILGTGGNGVTLNGSIISKDEAMTVYSLPMRENYDMRIRERSLTTPPLIDINLPRSPTVLRNSWQDRGFTY